MKNLFSMKIASYAKSEHQEKKTFLSKLSSAVASEIVELWLKGFAPYLLLSFTPSLRL